MNNDDFQDLIGIFIGETQEFLQSMETNLLLMEKNSDVKMRSQAVKDLFRAAHSIKGSALMFGFESIAQAAHSLEDCFAILRDCSDLSQLRHNTVTKLLEVVDHLRKITDRVLQGNGEFTQEIEAIAQFKAQLESQLAQYIITAPVNKYANYAVIKLIFENDFLSIIARLETEISQLTEENIFQILPNLNNIYYQISGISGMLQLPEVSKIAEELQSLIDSPKLTVEQLKTAGWAIAQNLQTARSQVLQGEAINVKKFGTGEQETKEEEEKTSTLVDVAEQKENNSQSPIPNPQSLIPAAENWSRPTIRVDLERLTELVNLVGELVINRTNFELQEAQLRSEVRRIRKSILNLNHFSSELREEYDQLSIGNLENNQINQNSNSQTFDLLELNKYTEFHSTVQSAIETTQVIATSIDQIDSLAIKFERSTDQLRRITNRLRSRVIQLRVVAFSRVVDHLPRAIRDLSRTYHKDVNLLLLGRETLIDETLIDALRDPLVHLIRNAFDHGIELPEVRLAAGKPPSGTIEIAARHQGGQTIITIADDGKGIDPEAIRRRVVEVGFFTAEQVKELSIAELYEFLFYPGFSTAKEVTNLSGRGVGLDVVRDNLRQVRGSVRVDSRPGKGTTFILKLPLILSITSALMVSVNHHTIAVPLDAVEEILHIQPEQIEMAVTQPMLRWHEEFIRLVTLSELLHYNVAHIDAPSPNFNAQNSLPVMVLSCAEGVLAIAIERLIGQQEIVVKPLPPPLSKPRGILGSTILADGEVVTILDVDDLIGQFNNPTATNNTVGVDLTKPPLQMLPPNSHPQILIVDDSYTIRHLLSLSLSKARYRVAQAKDGQDALAQLEKGIDCDLIIADIEMPKMDGFELLRNLKSHPKFASIPVTMLTSRSGFKHRQMAKELGVIEYFTKPYNEAQLLETIAKILPS